MPPVPFGAYWRHTWPLLRREIGERGVMPVLKDMWQMNACAWGELRGTDEHGNRYYENTLHPYNRSRWIIYGRRKNYDASNVTPEWSVRDSREKRAKEEVEQDEQRLIFRHRLLANLHFVLGGSRHQWLHNMTDDTPDMVNMRRFPWQLHPANRESYLSDFGAHPEFVPKGAYVRQVGIVPDKRDEDVTTVVDTTPPDQLKPTQTVCQVNTTGTPLTNEPDVVEAQYWLHPKRQQAWPNPTTGFCPEHLERIHEPREVHKKHLEGREVNPPDEKCAYDLIDPQRKYEYGEAFHIPNEKLYEPAKKIYKARDPHDEPRKEVY